jgi:hypothetical protein
MSVQREWSEPLRELWLAPAQLPVDKSYVYAMRHVGSTALDLVSPITRAFEEVGTRVHPTRRVDSFVLDLVPLVGTAKAVQQLVMGVDLVTGEASCRWLDAIATVPIAGAFVSKGVKIYKAGAAAAELEHTAMEAFRALANGIAHLKNPPAVMRGDSKAATDFLMKKTQLIDALKNGYRPAAALDPAVQMARATATKAFRASLGSEINREFAHDPAARNEALRLVKQCDIDHIIDLQLNGPNALANLQLLDRSVNRSVGKQLDLLFGKPHIAQLLGKETTAREMLRLTVAASNSVRFKTALANEHLIRAAEQLLTHHSGAIPTLDACSDAATSQRRRGADEPKTDMRELTDSIDSDQVYDPTGMLAQEENNPNGGRKRSNTAGAESSAAAGDAAFDHSVIPLMLLANVMHRTDANLFFSRHTTEVVLLDQFGRSHGGGAGGAQDVSYELSASSRAALEAGTTTALNFGIGWLLSSPGGRIHVGDMLRGIASSAGVQFARSALADLLGHNVDQHFTNGLDSRLTAACSAAAVQVSYALLNGDTRAATKAAFESAASYALSTATGFNLTVGNSTLGSNHSFFGREMQTVTQRQGVSAPIPGLPGVSGGIHFDVTVYSYREDGATIHGKSHGVGANVSALGVSVSVGLSSGNERAETRVWQDGDMTKTREHERSYSGELGLSLRGGDRAQQIRLMPAWSSDTRDTVVTRRADGNPLSTTQNLPPLHIGSPPHAALPSGGPGILAAARTAEIKASLGTNAGLAHQAISKTVLPLEAAATRTEHVMSMTETTDESRRFFGLSKKKEYTATADGVATETLTERKADTLTAGELRSSAVYLRADSTFTDVISTRKSGHGAHTYAPGERRQEQLNTMSIHAVGVSSKADGSPYKTRQTDFGPPSVATSSGFVVGDGKNGDGKNGDGKTTLTVTENDMAKIDITDTVLHYEREPHILRELLVRLKSPDPSVRAYGLQLFARLRSPDVIVHTAAFNELTRPTEQVHATHQVIGQQETVVTDSTGSNDKRTCERLEVVDAQYVDTRQDGDKSYAAEQQRATTIVHTMGVLRTIQTMDAPRTDTVRERFEVKGTGVEGPLQVTTYATARTDTVNFDHTKAAGDRAIQVNGIGTFSVAQEVLIATLRANHDASKFGEYDAPETYTETNIDRVTGNASYATETGTATANNIEALRPDATDATDAATNPHAAPVVTRHYKVGDHDLKLDPMTISSQRVFTSAKAGQPLAQKEDLQMDAKPPAAHVNDTHETPSIAAAPATSGVIAHPPAPAASGVIAPLVYLAPPSGVIKHGTDVGALVHSRGAPTVDVRTIHSVLSVVDSINRQLNAADAAKVVAQSQHKDPAAETLAGSAVSAASGASVAAAAAAWVTTHTREINGVREIQTITKDSGVGSGTGFLVESTEVRQTELAQFSEQSNIVADADANNPFLATTDADTSVCTNWPVFQTSVQTVATHGGWLTNTVTTERVTTDTKSGKVETADPVVATTLSAGMERGAAAAAGGLTALLLRKGTKAITVHDLLELGTSSGESFVMGHFGSVVRALARQDPALAMQYLGGAGVFAALVSIAKNCSDRKMVEGKEMKIRRFERGVNVVSDLVQASVPLIVVAKSMANATPLCVAASSLIEVVKGTIMALGNGDQPGGLTKKQQLQDVGARTATSAVATAASFGTAYALSAVAGTTAASLVSSAVTAVAGGAAASIFGAVATAVTPAIMFALVNYGLYSRWYEPWMRKRRERKRLTEEFAELCKELRLPLDASESTTGKRFRRLALNHHPDRGGNRVDLEHVVKQFDQLRQVRAAMVAVGLTLPVRAPLAADPPYDSRGGFWSRAAIYIAMWAERNYNTLVLNPLIIEPTVGDIDTVAERSFTLNIHGMD